MILILIIYIMATYGIHILFNKIIKFVEIDSDELKKYFKIKFDISENKLIRNLLIFDDQTTFILNGIGYVRVNLQKFL